MKVRKRGNVREQRLKKKRGENEGKLGGEKRKGIEPDTQKV